MRDAILALLLTAPAAQAQPAYSWVNRADEPDRTYLYLAGRQVGGWDYRAGTYRPFDGADWGPPVATAPVPPPARRVVVVAPPAAPLPPLRGPLRNRAATIFGEAIAEGTVRVVREIPGAVADAVRRGDYRVEYNFSVTPSPQPADVRPAAPTPTPPAAPRR